MQVPTRQQSARRFTLIELLAVIFIILVLASMLLPVLGRARYRAKLTVCSANLHQLGVFCMAYAAEHDRDYPYRRILEIQTTQFAKPQMLKLYGKDDRCGYVGFEYEAFLLCPFVKRFDIPGSQASARIEAAYALWYGWSYNGEQPMDKVGDRFTFGGNRFNVLASDVLSSLSSGNSREDTHPDFGTGILGLSVSPDYNVNAYSWWESSLPRGPSDANFLFDDGHVKRYSNVSEGWTNYPDLVDVPVWDRGPFFPGDRMALPPAD